MASGKRKTAAGGGRALAHAAAQRDIAEAERKARAARTPVAKAATRQVVEAKKRAYSGEAARAASSPVPRATKPPAASGGTAGGSRAKRPARRRQA